MQHHEEMDKQDKERRDEFKKHEMEKEHKRREHLKDLDEKARQEEELRYKTLQEKHHNASKNLHHPVRWSFFHFLLYLLNAFVVTNMNLDQTTVSYSYLLAKTFTTKLHSSFPSP